MAYIYIFVGGFVAILNLVLIIFIYTDKEKKEYNIPYKVFYILAVSVVLIGIVFIAQGINILFSTTCPPI
jgi:hypothetical protein